MNGYLGWEARKRLQWEMADVVGVPELAEILPFVDGDAAELLLEAVEELVPDQRERVHDPAAGTQLSLAESARFVQPMWSSSAKRFSSLWKRADRRGFGSDRAASAGAYSDASHFYCRPQRRGRNPEVYLLQEEGDSQIWSRWHCEAIRV